MKKHQLGDAPIEPKHYEQMKFLAAFLDREFNPGQMGDAREVGFVLLVFPFEGHEGRCNYISNADRRDIVTLMKEQIARFEGQPDVTGHG